MINCATAPIQPLSYLPMTTWHCAPFIAHRERPTALLTPPLEDGSTIFGTHTREKAVFAAARNTLWLPGSLWHKYLTPSISSRRLDQCTPDWCLLAYACEVHISGLPLTTDYVADQDMRGLQHYTRGATPVSNTMYATYKQNPGKHCYQG